MTSELEANIVSVERIKEYTETPTEVGGCATVLCLQSACQCSVDCRCILGHTVRMCTNGPSTVR